MRSLGILRQKQQVGFTLMELMIVVAIAGILAAIALPAYNESIRKSKRAEGAAALANYAQRFERCFTESFSYTGTNCPAVNDGSSNSTENGYYNIKVESTATSYTLTALKTFDDDYCGDLSLTHTGQKAETGTKGVSYCW
ncbi:type IV pilin protein [Marinobacterium marinum]|uniref:Prepilin-type N-terminal cleavage/methylation domain-containing protein n=1 Tax=Marinobacterium marinum TaxID=2756129 RepID=A0A7W1WW44_9GAMM|nr:type IV pilin protein [Marinobacterium marinum]MBA4501301.1 prepilin-type N-terminal cleavage/methylation domain-containing protein [Marinobacterium marinum]